MTNSKRISLRTLGPGLIWAAAAIGVSHLVQSTKAGANYGFDLVWIIIIVNFLKYPFFEFGPRYAAATGESLIHGYNKLGKWAVIVYFILSILTMFPVQAAVTAVTAGLFANVFHIGLNSFHWTIIILLSSTIIIIVGKYSILDKLIKFIIIILSISTLVAVFSALFSDFETNNEITNSFEWEFTDIAFLIALAGWMPSTIDISVWHSMWAVEKSKSLKRRINIKESLFDFNIGYIGTAILSVGFLTLGALVMHSSGESFSPKGTVFAGQLINLYTKSIGSWAYFLIAIAALTTMFSTTLTVLDAFPRVLKPSGEIVFNRKSKDSKPNVFWLFVLLFGTIIILQFYVEKMQMLVNFATTLSFLVAPVFAWLNFRAVSAKHVSDEFKPKLWLKILSYTGLTFLIIFSLYYLIWRFFI